MFYIMFAFVSLSCCSMAHHVPTPFTIVSIVVNGKTTKNAPKMPVCVCVCVYKLSPLCRCLSLSHTETRHSANAPHHNHQ